MFTVSYKAAKCLSVIGYSLKIERQEDDMLHCVFCSKAYHLATEMHNHLRHHHYEPLPKGVSTSLVTSNHSSSRGSPYPLNPTTSVGSISRVPSDLSASTLQAPNEPSENSTSVLPSSIFIGPDIEHAMEIDISSESASMEPQTAIVALTSDTFDICSNTDVIIPSHLCAPIEGIKLEGQALECQECQYICATNAGMRTHWSNNHHDQLNQYPITNSRFKTVEAQKLFDSSSGHRQYFKVDSRLIGIPSEDTFSLFIQKYVKKDSLLPTVAPPSNDRDLSLLVKKRGWYNHLQEFCNDSSKRALLIQMASMPMMGKEKAKLLPPGVEKTLSRLPEVVTSYMKQIHEEQQKASRLTLRSIMHYPPENSGDSFSIYAIPTTFHNANHQLIQFIAMCLRQIKGHPCGYQLRLLERHNAIGLDLWNALEKDNSQEAIIFLHLFFWQLCGTSTAELKEEWGDALQAFIAVSALSSSGTFKHARDITSDLARWKYLLRAMVLHQIISSKESFLDGEEGPFKSTILFPSNNVFYPNNCAKINQLLMVLLHTVSSQPPRGTEEIDIRLWNGHRHRNIFLLFGQVWKIIQATKTENTIGHSTFIPAVLPPEVAQHLFYYLVHVRPLETFLSEKVYGASAKTLYQEFLYVQLGKQVTSDQFSHSMSQIMASQCGAAIGIRAWRHLAIALKREFIPPSLVDPFQNHQDVGDMAASHSTWTARKNYAIDQNSLPLLSTDAMLAHEAFCKCWHSVLHFGTLPPPIPMRQLQNNQYQRTIHQNALRTDASLQAIKELGSEIQQNMMAQSQSFLSALTALKEQVQSLESNAVNTHPLQNVARPLSTPTEPVVQALNHQSGEIDNDELEYLDIDPSHLLPLSVEMQDTATLIHQDKEANDDEQVYWNEVDGDIFKEEKALSLLQQLFSNPEATFKSQDQLKLATWCIQPAKDTLAIMGTGEGKSIAWEISGLLHQGTSRVTIAILPFKAIITDAIQRARSHGLKCLRFKAEDHLNHHYDSIKNLDILFAVAENLSTTAWYQMIASIKDDISLIIVDECHQVLSSRQFRTAFVAIERLYEVGAPRLFMTATMPLNLQTQFLEAVKVDQGSYDIIRSKRTQRANLGWCLLSKAAGKRCSYQDLFLLARKMETELKKKESDRGIIFVRRREDVENICSMYLLKYGNNWLGYHSTLSNLEEIDRQWRHGVSFWIVATSSLMNGVDYGDVVNVIFFEPPFGLLDLVQGGGRAGRRGEKSYVIVLQSDKLTEAPQEEKDYQQIGALNEWLTNGRCRRGVIGSKLDGEEDFQDGTWFDMYKQDKGFTSHVYDSAMKRRDQIMETKKKKLAKSQRLSELMVSLEDYCGGCWARNGSLQKSHEKPVTNCIGASKGSSQWEDVFIQKQFWARFFGEHMRLEEKFKYCFWCRLPQDREYKPACHTEIPSKDKGCKYKWKIEHVLGWILGGDSNFKKMCTKFGVDSLISAESLGVWLKRESSSDGFNNALEVVLWFAEEERKFLFTDMLLTKN
ncbi:hypothetical protein EDB84DRAFT_1445251 [Lactarius hengduanensis]|nr:hypothetical protein EDB84DRAFT_1445251 [Lactarius hengduanensis]